MTLVVTLMALASSAAFAQAPASSSRDDPNRLICRSSQETGSLVRRRRQCFTAAEWLRIDEAARDNGRYILENSTGRPCGVPEQCVYDPITDTNRSPN